MSVQSNLFNILQERGFVQQASNEDALRDLFSNEQVSAYIGFDPSSDSLHVGSLLQIIMLVHVQRAGHRPVAVIGGGTGLVGDPSGKDEMRQLMEKERLEKNFNALRKQLSLYLDFNGGKAVAVNNADWLEPLNYIDFLREIGRHFSVNRMLSAEAYKQRMEKGLSFLEFNYQLLQAYDFLVLYRKYGCRVQMGGDDQWGNILAGVDIIRRMEGVEAYALTSALLTTAEGKKMGKTAKGAVWLDSKKTSVYDFYQYWINVDDRDVEKFLRIFTFLPLSEIQKLARLEHEEKREAKKILAREVTAFVHGEKEAKKAAEASEALFEGKGEISDAPCSRWSAAKLDEGTTIVDLLVITSLCDSKSNASRLVKQGGAYINGERITDFRHRVTNSDFSEEGLLLRAGKKKYHRVILE